MRKTTAILSFILVAISYQNCAKQGFEVATTSSQLSSGASSDSQISLPGASSSGSSNQQEVAVLKASDIRFIETAEVASAQDMSKIIDSNVAAAQAATRVQYSAVRLIADLQSSQLNLIDYNNVVVKKFCLPASVVASVKAVIENAKLCQTVVPDEQICSQLYQAPHTFLHHMDGRTVNKLGEGSNGCGQGKVEFCGQVADQFKSLWSLIKANRDSYTCP